MEEKKLYALIFSDIVKKTITNYKCSNAQAYKKVLKLLTELQEHPRTGIGHVEPLKKGNNITYSREITKKDRLIYDINDEKITVTIVSAEGHYKDK